MRRHYHRRKDPAYRIGTGLAQRNRALGHPFRPLATPESSGLISSSSTVCVRLAPPSESRASLPPSKSGFDAASRRSRCSRTCSQAIHDPTLALPSSNEEVLSRTVRLAPRCLPAVLTSSLRRFYLCATSLATKTPLPHELPSMVTTARAIQHDALILSGRLTRTGK